MPVTINASTSSGLVQTADTSGNIELQSNGSTKVTVSSSGLAIGQYNPSTSLITSGTAVNSTSGTSIDFTSIPSWVKRITVMFDGVSTNGSSVPLLQIGAGLVTTSGYSSSGSNLSSGVTTTSSTAGFIVSSASASSDTRSGAFVISSMGSNKWAMQGACFITSGFVSVCGGSVTLSGTLDRVRITTVNGTDTFDAGTINILYE